MGKVYFISFLTFFFFLLPLQGFPFLHLNLGFYEFGNKKKNVLFLSSLTSQNRKNWNFYFFYFKFRFYFFATNSDTVVRITDNMRGKFPIILPFPRYYFVTWYSLFFFEKRGTDSNRREMFKNESKWESRNSKDGNLPFFNFSLNISHTHFHRLLISSIQPCHWYYSSNKPFSVVQPYEKLFFSFLSYCWWMNDFHFPFIVRHNTLCISWGI